MCSAPCPKVHGSQRAQHGRLSVSLYYQQQYGLDFLALRYSAIYGERQHKRAIAVTQMVTAYESIRAGKRPIIERDGQQVTDYIYAGDAARGNLMAMASTASGTGMNIVSGCRRTASSNSC